MIPVNIDAANAIDIGSVFPYLTTQDAFDTATCYPLWYKYTASINGTLRLLGFGYDDPTSECLITSVYRPFAIAWTGPDSSTLSGWVTETWHATLYIPVIAGQTYWISFTPAASGGVPANPSPAILTLKADLFTSSLPAAIGSYLIPSEGGSRFPAAVVDRLTGDVLGLVYNIAAGEGGAQLTDGKMLIEDDSQRLTQQTRAILYDGQLNQIAVVNWDTSADGWYDTYIGSNKSDKFYAGYNSDYVNFSGNASFRTISNSGVGSGWTELEVPGLLGLCPSNDESILYYSISNGANRQVKKWDITGGTPLADLAPNYDPGDSVDPGTPYKCHDILVLNDNTILVAYVLTYTDAGELFTDARVIHYSAIGAILNTYKFGNDASTGVRITYNYDDMTTFVVYQHDIIPVGGIATCIGRSAGTVQITVIKVSDGSTILNTQSTWTTGGKYASVNTTGNLNDFGPSGSCPIFRLLAQYPSSLTGTLIVTKATLPAGQPTSFTFTAAGGLSPTSFSLLDTQSRQFDDITPGGGYSIVETADPNYTIDYDVSNGSPIDNISIAAGETVTIVVTNTRLPNKYSGIYKIVPNKTNDTLWTKFDPDETIDVKIPDPFIKTALIGS